MTTNLSIWLRVFRPPFQRAYPQLDETDRELADLLRRADERAASAVSADRCEKRAR